MLTPRPPTLLLYSEACKSAKYHIFPSTMHCVQYNAPVNVPYTACWQIPNCQQTVAVSLTQGVQNLPFQLFPTSLMPKPIHYTVALP
jgi:hypothetical protein